jgi:RimJ/RimL family protein N-acetyltransferase
MTSETSLVGWTPRPLPTTEPLVGARVTLVPTDVTDHAMGLFEATRAGDPSLWDYLPYGPFADEAEFEQWLATHVADPGLITEPVLDGESGLPLGCASFMRIDPANGVIEIGNVFLGAGLQRTAAATEAFFLMMRHAFDDLGYRRLEWKCDAANARSMRAAERLGFTYEGTFRQHRIVKGKNRDTAWFAIIDKDWPAVRAALEAWLAPDNFDADGDQLRRLDDLRTGF